MVSYNTLLRGVRRLCAEAKVSIITPHEMRHSTSELWYQDGGASKEDIRRLLSQKNLSTTERYMHQADDRLREVAKAVGTEPAPTERPQPPEPSRAILRLVR